MVNTTEVKKIESDIVGAGKYVVIEIDKLFAIIERHLPGHMPEVKNFKTETNNLIVTSVQIHNPEPVGNETMAATAGGTSESITGAADGDSLGEPSSTASTSPSSSIPSTSTVNTSPETQTSAESILSGGESS